MKCLSTSPRKAREVLVRVCERDTLEMGSKISKRMVNSNKEAEPTKVGILFDQQGKRLDVTVRTERLSNLVQTSGLFGHLNKLESLLQSYPQEYPRHEIANETGKHCPMRAAVNGYLRHQRRCDFEALLLLLRYNFRCNCVQDGFRYQVTKCHSLIRYADAIILEWFFLANGFTRSAICLKYSYSVYDNTNEEEERDRIMCPSEPKLKLVNLTRIRVRNLVSTFAGETNTNFAECMKSLPIPEKLTQFLLMNDLRYEQVEKKLGLGVYPGQMQFQNAGFIENEDNDLIVGHINNETCQICE